MLYWSNGFPSISCLSLHSSMKAEPITESTCEILLWRSINRNEIGNWEKRCAHIWILFDWYVEKIDSNQTSVSTQDIYLGTGLGKLISNYKTVSGIEKEGGAILIRFFQKNKIK